MAVTAAPRAGSGNPAGWTRTSSGEAYRVAVAPDPSARAQLADLGEPDAVAGEHRLLRHREVADRGDEATERACGVVDDPAGERVAVGSKVEHLVVGLICRRSGGHLDAR